MYMLFSKLHTSSSASSPGRSGARAKKKGGKGLDLSLPFSLLLYGLKLLVLFD